jgi:two-component system, LuxR family, response regulator FixJ
MNSEKSHLIENEVKLSENKQIFIVDDDVSVCRALSVLLVTYGFTVDTFTSAEEFFNAVSNSVPGCLILDIHMPGLDGWKAQQRIIGSGSKRSVIIISADKDEENYKRALKAGAVGYLQKPFDDQSLVDLINIAIKKESNSDKTGK